MFKKTLEHIDCHCIDNFFFLWRFSTAWYGTVRYGSARLGTGRYGTAQFGSVCVSTAV